MYIYVFFFEGTKITQNGIVLSISIKIFYLNGEKKGGSSEKKRKAIAVFKN